MKTIDEVKKFIKENEKANIDRVAMDTTTIRMLLDEIKLNKTKYEVEKAARKILEDRIVENYYSEEKSCKQILG